MQSYDFSSHATATTEIYTLSLHDALPIFSLAFFNAMLYENRPLGGCLRQAKNFLLAYSLLKEKRLGKNAKRSEEHTSELQSRRDLVCRLLLEKKNIIPIPSHHASLNTLSF